MATKIKTTIDVFGRLKPVLSKKKRINVQIRCSSENCDQDTLIITGKTNADYINHKPESYAFLFRKVLDESASQESVFNTVAKPVVQSALGGYNGTIFAYGQLTTSPRSLAIAQGKDSLSMSSSVQLRMRSSGETVYHQTWYNTALSHYIARTGSGKTFTISGMPQEKGIVPRTFSYIFDSIKKNSDETYQVCLSYLEIYNEHGYDLLKTANRMENTEKVVLQENEAGEMQLRNLSLHTIDSLEEAMVLFSVGETNRMTEETPMNPTSSRSHCIITLYLTVHTPNSLELRHSKLHLIDLAGSERVEKSGIGGQIFSEACHINLSLHYLEQVIVALSESNRTHVPYRNSMMTSALRDSLGGNCLTVMIALLAVEQDNIEETISTCRFAQRVAMVKNQPKINLERDPLQEIEFLKAEINKLKNNLTIINEKEGYMDTELNDEEVNECRLFVSQFLRSKECEELEMFYPTDPRKVKKCFQLLKHESENQTMEQRTDLFECDMIPLISIVQDMISHKSQEENILSDVILESDIQLGVLHKSVLGPLLFLIYPNVIQDSEMGRKLLIFSDGTNVWPVGESVGHMPCFDACYKRVTKNKPQRRQSITMEDNETFSKYAHAQEDGSKFDKYQKLVIKIQNEMNNMLKEICKIQDKILILNQNKKEEKESQTMLTENTQENRSKKIQKLLKKYSVKVRDYQTKKLKLEAAQLKFKKIYQQIFQTFSTKFKRKNIAIQQENVCKQDNTQQQNIKKDKAFSNKYNINDKQALSFNEDYKQLHHKNSSEIMNDCRPVAMSSEDLSICMSDCSSVYSLGSTLESAVVKSDTRSTIEDEKDLIASGSSTKWIGSNTNNICTGYTNKDRQFPTLSDYNNDNPSKNISYISSYIDSVDNMEDKSFNSPIPKNKQTSWSTFQLTGDKEVDEEIINFYKSKNTMLTPAFLYN